MSACNATHPRKAELDRIPGESAGCILSAGHARPHVTCWGRLWRDGDPPVTTPLAPEPAVCRLCGREIPR